MLVIIIHYISILPLLVMYGFVWKNGTHKSTGFVNGQKLRGVPYSRTRKKRKTDSSLAVGLHHMVIKQIFRDMVNHMFSQTGVGNYPHFSHHPTIGDMSSPTNTSSSDVKQVPNSWDIYQTLPDLFPMTQSLHGAGIFTYIDPKNGPVL